MNIVLGVTAGIAAYKTPQLVRLLTKKGYNVRVILTEKCKGVRKRLLPLALCLKILCLQASHLPRVIGIATWS